MTRAFLDVRYSFTAQFLVGAAIFARSAHEVENRDPSSVDEFSQTEHRAYVVGAVIQSAAAIEAESAEISMYGPGHHLGSNGVDKTAREFLRPLSDLIDSEAPVRRYALILHLLRKPALDFGKQPAQSVALVMKLRNELMHYKSKWDSQMKDGKDTLQQLSQLQFRAPPFASKNSTFFPHKCLSASLASWSARAGSAFINEFYNKLGISSPLTSYTRALACPAPQNET